MGLGSGIRDPGSGIRKKPIPDPGSRGQEAPDPGSGSATLHCTYNTFEYTSIYCTCTVSSLTLMDGMRENCFRFPNRFSIFLIIDRPWCENLYMHCWVYFDIWKCSKFRWVPSHKGALAEPIVVKNSLELTVESVRSDPDLQSNLELEKFWVLNYIQGLQVPSFNLSHTFCVKDV